MKGFKRALKAFWARAWGPVVRVEGRTIHVREGWLRYVMPVFAGGAPVKRLARGWALSVESAVPATFVAIGGINTFSESPTSEGADATDFNSAGWSESSPAQRGFDISLDGFFLEDAASGARDAGQARVEALSREVDVAGMSNFKLVSPAGATNGEVITFACWLELGGRGGGNNDNTSWGATVHASGEPTIA